ncbi:MAG: YeaH/YhbH family protein [Alphaproteobacteria bacterium]|nr:YeaH/YhbH family protein [Alphaproteobacteria bacterium]MCZ6591864.1 YeaH/YhbH family protein [Alphaproteobacteria bacterium]MCZ6838664.1 YeaH/YhbH family protein [Alphaproteobacteria bacterium]MCZ6844780.1 YeaH/YhbH family protein [Alphaproteobacteria bacterium]
MIHLIDRRLNPRDKSLGNRQRFLRRARRQIKEAVDKAVSERDVADAGQGGKISIPSKGISEPRFRHSRSGGNHERVFPGNEEYVPGDKIPKPQGDAGGGGKDASEGGEGADEFVFALSRSEFLDILFEDLELPDLIKSTLKDTKAVRPQRAGYSNYGTTPNLNVLRTMRNSIGRRVVLNRPTSTAILDLQNEWDELKAKDQLDAAQQQRLLALWNEIEELKRRQRAVPFIDPVDIRYNRYDPKPEPKTKAVMFCLMDVSGSMGQHEKDLAKRFFILLHLFLQRKYQRVELVFIRHTHVAQEVDEQTFFYSQESGGTKVSTALVEMQEVIRQRFPVSDWNIYAAQASDGDNIANDTGLCVELLENELLPLCQFYAYVEILTEQEVSRYAGTSNGKELWRGYRAVDEQWSKFSMKHIAKRSDIYPVFRELFAKNDKRVRVA